MRQIHSENELLPQNHSVEDLATTDEFPVDIKGLQIIPNDEPPNGVFGFMAIDPANDDNSFALKTSVFSPAARVEHDSRTEFVGALNGFVLSNLPVFDCSDPVTLRMGFLVLKGDGNEWHTLRMSLWKA